MLPTSCRSGATSFVVVVSGETAPQDRTGAGHVHRTNLPPTSSPTSSARAGALLLHLLEIFGELRHPSVVVLLGLLHRRRAGALAGWAQMRFEHSPPAVVELPPLKRAEERPAFGHEPAVDQRSPQLLGIAPRRHPHEVVHPAFRDPLL